MQHEVDNLTVSGKTFRTKDIHFFQKILETKEARLYFYGNVLLESAFSSTADPKATLPTLTHCGTYLNQTQEEGFV